jgi:hypothetical protein
MIEEMAGCCIKVSRNAMGFEFHLAGANGYTLESFIPSTGASCFLLSPFCDWHECTNIFHRFTTSRKS